jgi:hypothetical protein
MEGDSYRYRAYVDPAKKEGFFAISTGLSQLLLRTLTTEAQSARRTLRGFYHPIACLIQRGTEPKKKGFAPSSSLSPLF